MHQGSSESSAKKALSIKEACEAIGVGKTSLYALIKRGELQTLRIGRRHIVVQSSVDALIDRSATVRGK